MVTYQQESVDDLFEEIKPLIEAHYSEVAWRKDKIKLDPDWDAYRRLEAVDALRCYTARDDGKLVGYFICFVQNNLHYRGTREARNDVFYVEPTLRGFHVGTRLIREAEQALRAEGVHVMMLHIKTTHDWTKLAERTGFEIIEKIVAKYIGE